MVLHRHLLALKLPSQNWTDTIFWNIESIFNSAIQLCGWSPKGVAFTWQEGWQELLLLCNSVSSNRDSLNSICPSFSWQEIPDSTSGKGTLRWKSWTTRHSYKLVNQIMWVCNTTTNGLGFANVVLLKTRNFCKQYIVFIIFSHL